MKIKELDSFSLLKRNQKFDDYEKKIETIKRGKGNEFKKKGKEEKRGEKEGEEAKSLVWRYVHGNVLHLTSSERNLLAN